MGCSDEELIVFQLQFLQRVIGAKCKMKCDFVVTIFMHVARLVGRPVAGNVHHDRAKDKNAIKIIG